MPEEFDEKPAESIDFRYYSALIQRRLWYFLLPFFLGWLIVWSASWLMPSSYRSGTLILVEQPSVPKQYVVPNIDENIQNRLNSITQQILSRTRLLRIIDSLNLYAQDRSHLSPDELVEKMRKDIEIELVRSPERDQQLTSFNVFYSSTSPNVAQQVTSELTNLFISENLEVRQQQSENTTRFLENQLEQARQNLSEQEQRVREFKDQHLGELPGQLQSNLQILTGLQAQSQAEEDALSRAKQQNAYLESLIGQYRSLQGTPRAGGEAPVGLPALDQELDRLHNELAALTSRYTDRHPDVRKLRDQIAKTEKMKQQITEDLKAKSAPQANKSGGEAPGGAATPVTAAPMMELGSQLKANEIEITNRQRAIKDIGEQIGAYQARLNRSPVREQQLADLTRDYDQSRTNYDSLLAKKNESEMATDLEKRQQGEHFRILDAPSFPAKPYSPNRLKLFGIGLLVGVVLGAAFAVGAEISDDRIYSEKEFKQLLPVGVITEIPALTTVAEEKVTRRKMWLAWAGTGLVTVCIAAGFAVSYFRG